MCTHLHTCIKPTLKYIRLQFGKCQSQVDLGNFRFKFPARWAAETPDDYISEIPFSGRQAYVHIHIHTYITSIWEKIKLHFEWKVLPLLPNLKVCEGKNVAASQTFPDSPFLLWPPPIPTQMLESYPPTGDSSLSCSLSVFVMVFPYSSFSSVFHSSGTWLRLSGLQTPQIHGPCSPGFSLLLTSHFWYNFSSPTGPMLFSPSFTLFPLKIWGIFCLLLSLLCFFEYFSYFIAQDPLRSSASPIRHL